MTIKQAFAAAEILQSASPATLAALLPCSTLKFAQKGSHLFRDKEYVHTVYILIEGAATLYKINGNGERKVVFVYSGGGKALNEVILNGLPASIHCELLKDAWILCIPCRDLLSAMEGDFGLTKAVLDSMSLKIRRLYRQMKNTVNAIRGDKKLAAKLWKLSIDHGIPCEGGVRINLDLTVTYLADMLGSKRETVSRQLKTLFDNGLLGRDKNGCIVISDQDALKQYFKAP